MSGTAWQDAEVARRFLEGRRAAIPFGGAQLEMMLHLVAHFRPDPARIVDLGCGDGLLARLLLERCPKATALLLDHSPPMLDRAREAMAPFGARCEIRLADLNTPLQEQVREPVDAIVSGYAIHHLEDARKRRLYAEILDLLTPGGLFVNVEHVASAFPEGEALFDTLYIDHIAAHMGRPRAEVAHEYHTRPDKADNRLAPVGLQLQWLRDAGFEQVDCYFKWLELAVLAARKPA
jgi:tRNA (cmo5U34)-methyltransferase